MTVVKNGDGSVFAVMDSVVTSVDVEVGIDFMYEGVKFSLIDTMKDLGETFYLVRTENGNEESWSAKMMKEVTESDTFSILESAISEARKKMASKKKTTKKKVSKKKATKK